MPNKLTHEEFSSRLKLNENTRHLILKDQYTLGSALFLVECPIHGEYKTKASNLSHGHGCKKCGRDRVGKNLRAQFSDSIEVVKGKVLLAHGGAIEFVDEVYVNANTKAKFSCSIHGEWRTTTNKILVGRGCPRCNKSSKGEIKIRAFLGNSEFDFSEQYSFKDCRGKKYPLLFDFAVHIKNSLLLIEFQGGQHYKPIKFFGGEDGFKLSKKRDKTKLDYCKKNGIPLLLIKFDDKNWQDKIKNFLPKESLT